jgi:hypothetical protein
MKMAMMIDDDDDDKTDLTAQVIYDRKKFQLKI